MPAFRAGWFKFFAPGPRRGISGGTVALTTPDTGTDGTGMTATLIDDFLPEWDFHEVHRITIDAPHDVVMRAAMEVTWSEVPLAELLMKFTRNDMTTYRKILGDIEQRLGQDEHEILFGGIGSPKGAPELGEPRGEAFRAFAEPGCRKTVMNIRYAGGVLSTETRIKATDRVTRNQFCVYWTIIRFASGFIRRAVLAAIRRRVRRELRNQSRSEG